ncbi:similar to ribonuclease P complex subunit Pop1 [Plenodomus lingam JN3]|uniref:Similar to ribonuclease P complex subunit Pop1 n=1 Tax=Leptosphaeria maculans (strain JN3 / isolate v23.1.3 / race Av1-4-5-6-7-8) TaxID=985895 RepID=E4ZPE3_LEPMJ|nr:similar to ribonuclease P complex subunit Pop1 [Plenodomus lingam JN3]CBX93168.1 similar to ribonuclease P complex subunit Pop1 [Plenodomus lingam JN3]
MSVAGRSPHARPFGLNDGCIFVQSTCYRVYAKPNTANLSAGVSLARSADTDTRDSNFHKSGHLDIWTGQLHSGHHLLSHAPVSPVLRRAEYPHLELQGSGATIMADSSRKRKQTVDHGNHGNHGKRPRFLQKPQHNIAATPTRNAYPNGEINVKNFLKSHEVEIKSLEHAIKAAKQALTRRAFQDVPRELRRRTASHNPQRVPKRLRARSKQEAKEDNTPLARGTSGSGSGKGKIKFLRKEGREKSRQTWEERAKRRKVESSIEAPGKPESTKQPKQLTAAQATNVASGRRRTFPPLATPPTPPSRFRKRQKGKTWLPTHVWHSKRARMTDPKDPLWGFAIPLQPVVKAYRLTHRSATQRGAVAWDTSYMSTLGLEGAATSIINLLKSLNFATGSLENPWQDRGRAKRWMLGTRSWDGWICEREAIPPKKIALITAIWCVPDPQLPKRKLFIRVHPAAFPAVWNEVVRTAKVQKPCVTVQDLRYEIGSIEITGPAAAETLTSILVPIENTGAVGHAPQTLWGSLASTTDAASLPAGALLAFDISDPRLRDPPSTSPLLADQRSLDALTDILASWPIDTTQTTPSIFDRNARMAAARSMLSQKSINRRRSGCTLGEHPDIKPTDAQIPVLVYVSRASKTWTVLLPWKSVMAVWRSIMRYPVSTGGNPRFGGIKERRQVYFERSLPYFPYDCPGTDAGWAWELRERASRKHEWTKRPKGKRIEWTTIDLGNGRKGETGDPWACEWEYLLPEGINESGGKPGELRPLFQQLSLDEARNIVKEASSHVKDRHSARLLAVKISMIQRGTPTDCARVYRLPANNMELRARWLALMPQAGREAPPKKRSTYARSELPAHLQLKALARALTTPTEIQGGPPKAGEQDYPVVPDEEDLIGFVTTGNYNLCEGIPTAVANVALDRIMCAVKEGGGLAAENRLCIVRQAGSTIGRLARWEAV